MRLYAYKIFSECIWRPREHTLLIGHANADVNLDLMLKWQSAVGTEPLMQSVLTGCVYMSIAKSR